MFSTKKNIFTGCTPARSYAAERVASFLTKSLDVETGSANSHAVPGSQVAMDKLLASQILHPSGHLQPEAHQVLDRWVLREEQGLTIQFLPPLFLPSTLSTYVSLVTDEVAQVAVLHVGQDDQWRALGWEADPQQGEHVGVAEVLHDDALLQELGHLL